MSLIHRQRKVTRDHVVLSASVLSHLRSACLTSPELLWTCVTRLRPRGDDKEEVWEEEKEAETTGCFIQRLVKERKTRFPPSFYEHKRSLSSNYSHLHWPKTRILLDAQ